MTNKRLEDIVDSLPVAGVLRERFSTLLSALEVLPTYSESGFADIGLGSILTRVAKYSDYVEDKDDDSLLGEEKFDYYIDRQDMFSLSKEIDKVYRFLKDVAMRHTEAYAGELSIVTPEHIFIPPRPIDDEDKENILIAAGRGFIIPNAAPATSLHTPYHVGSFLSDFVCSEDIGTKLVSIPYYSRKTLPNLSSVLTMTLQHEEQATKISFLDKYLNLQLALGDRVLCAAFDEELSDCIWHRKTSGDVFDFLSMIDGFAHAIKDVGPFMRPAVFTALNQRSGRESEYKSDYAGSFVSAVNAHAPKLVDSEDSLLIQPALYNPLFTRLAFLSMKKGLRYYLSEAGVDSAAYLPAMLADLIRIVNPLSKSLESLLPSDGIEMKKRQIGSSHTEELGMHRLMGDFSLKGLFDLLDFRGGQRNAFSRDIAESLGDYDVDSFIERLGAFYFVVARISPSVGIDKDEGPFMCAKYDEEATGKFLHNLDTIKTDALSVLFLNVFVNNWRFRQGTKFLENTLAVMAQLVQKKIPDIGRYKVLSYLIHESDRRPHVAERLHEFLQVSENIDEIIECVTIDSQSYEVVSKLGKGVSGSTYLVYSPELKKKRALKLIRGGSKGKNESSLLAKLEGQDLENIVQIHAAGTDIAAYDKHKRFAIVMEYVEGQDLDEVLRCGPISPAMVLSYSGQIFNGLLSLRNQGIFHRDVRPKNIRVRRNGTLKIIDFSNAAGMKGKPSDNRRYGGRTDFFSLGLITYEMATGSHLVAGRTAVMGSETHAQEVFTHKKEILDRGKITSAYREKIRQNVPQEMQEIIFACLESKDPEHIRSKYEAARQDLRYYFMSKEELIDRIRELEKTKV